MKKFKYMMRILSHQYLVLLLEVLLSSYTRVVEPTNNIWSEPKCELKM